MNYSIDSTDPMFNKFEFASFYLDEMTIKNIKEFKRSGSLKNEKQYFQLTHLVKLIESNYIHSQTMDNQPGFEYIKLDSISFLKVKPNLKNITTLDVKGGITCYSDFFTVDIDLNHAGLDFPTVIYRSARLSYLKTN